MKSIILFVFCLSLLLAFSTCENGKEQADGDEGQLIAFGTYPRGSNVDKAKWGDFLFILEIGKSIYSIHEPIIVQTYFSNIGSKTIVLDGILPYRQSANPPTIDIWLNDSILFRTNKVLDNLLNENDIVVEPQNKIKLMRFNLLEVEGILMKRNTINDVYVGKDTSNIGSMFKKGTYKISAIFNPNPQAYWSMTDTLTFEIK